MVNFNKCTTNRVSGIRRFVLVAVLLSITLTSRSSPAQDHYYGSSTSSLESSMSWPWWHSFYFHANGSPRYANGFATSTRNTQYRLPVNPPISGPSYGYYQPCWKQMPLVRRCVACETYPANREIPTMNTTPSPESTQIPQVPPAPEATDDAEAGSTEPSPMESPEAEPTPQ